MKETKSVCAFPFRVVESRIEVLLLHRVPKKGGFWQGVTGKIEKGESPLQAAARETLEETGLQPIEVLATDYIHVYYHPKSDKTRREPTFRARVSDGEVILSKEHDMFEWVSFDKALTMLRWEGNRAALRSVQTSLSL
jgi:8-oxo-dGTP pyrophosphatase MutT (NUDIX family)